MKKVIFLFNLIFLLMTSTQLMAAREEGEKVNTDVFSIINLDYPGLEAVKAEYQKGNEKKAAELLLNYYRTRTGIHNPDVDMKKITVSARQRKWADDALEHTFYVHDGYQPSYNYGKDINWKYWPVKDNELRWQLHRHKWFTPMGKVYQITKDEKYAIEWKAEYLDWIKKNPLVEVTSNQYEMKDNKKFSDDVENARFAWRPLEISHRLQDQISQFTLFVNSPNFTPEFLTEFLVNYNRHAEYILGHYSKMGNHLLFEAQRMFFAGTFFPELKDAKTWQQSGIGILNREIKKQVFDDGGQFELDPHYHLACIGIFIRALVVAQANNCISAIPQSYVDTVENMITFYFNICFPDYSNPCFSDAKKGDMKEELGNYRKWMKLFPNNEAIKWFATQGKKGKAPANLSKGFLTSGFFTFRNGWDMNSTVMVVKAGPKGEWHCQPDNGTFDLWFNGKNLFPDSGSYIYAGPGEVQKMRDWFRQTCVHNTLTLDNKNLETTESKTLLWQPDGNQQVLVTQNPSYRNLDHRRTVFFVDQTYYVIVDETIGSATGQLNLHYLLTDGKTSTEKNTIRTEYKGESNVMIACSSASAMDLKQEEGWYSTAYRKKTARPSFSFNVNKKDEKPVRFVTVIYPGKDVKSVSAMGKVISSTDKSLKVSVKVNGKKQQLSWNIQ